MKTITAKNFSDLSETQRNDLILKEQNHFLEFLIDGFIVPDELKDQRDRAIQKADRLGTPWFLGEILMEDKEIASFIHDSAVANLNETLFVEQSDVAVMVI
jgi:hypothetical protein